MWPYAVNISLNARYFFKLGYKDLGSGDDEIYEINRTTYKILNHCDRFNVTIYLLQSLTCNNSIPIELFNITAEKNITKRVITEDDIPSECKIDIYPNDIPQIQPEEEQVPYSFIYDGNCEMFDDIVNACHDKTIDYPFCSFINNAIEAKCGISYSTMRAINPKASKLYITVTSQSNIIEFEKLKHKIIAHIRCSNITDPLLYFQSNGDFGTCDNTIRIRGDIYDTVSHLTLENLTYDSYYHDIDVDTLYLKNCIHQVYGKYISPKNLIIENSTYYKKDSHKFNTFSVVLSNLTNRPQYLIRCQNGKLILSYKDWNDEFYTDYKEISPYIADEIGLFLTSHFIDIHADFEYKNYNPINLNISILSIGDDVSSYSNPNILSDKEKYFVNFTTSGNWSNAGENNSITITAFYDYVDLNFTNNGNITINKNQAIFNHPSKWTPEYYQPLNNTDTSVLYYIILVDSYQMYSCESNVQTLLNCRYNNCHSFENNNRIDYIIDAKCANPDTLNEVLANIHENTDKLIIENHFYNADINLTKLPHQVVVELMSTKASLTSKTLENDSKKKVSEDDENLHVNIYGNIKEKVSYLTISNSAFTFVDAPLNVHTLKLLSSSRSKYYISEHIQTDHVIVDFSSHVNLLINSVLDTVKQYTIIIPYDADEEEDYRIIFNYDKTFLYKKGKNDEDYTSISDSFGYIPIEYGETIGLFAVSHNFDFYIGDLLRPQGKLIPINISILNEDYIDPDDLRWLKENDSKYKIFFNQSGIWKPENELNVTLTAYQNLISVGTHPNITVEKKGMFNFTTHQLVFPTPTLAPYATEIPTKTPIPETIKNLFENDKNEITNLDEINTALTDKFEEMKGAEGNKIVVVNANSFPFHKDLNENEFIKPIPNAKIDFVDGNLNLILPDEGMLTVKLNKSEDVRLQMNGNGKIEFEQTNSGKKINIKNQANINGSLSITVPDEIESFSFESIDLSKDGEINCKSKSGKSQSITINNLKVDTQSNTKLSTAVISNSLTIPQSSKLELHNVDVKNSDIYYHIMNFDSLDSILSGDFKDPPKSIKITSSGSTDQIISKTFDLLEGNFEDGICKQWVEKIEFNVQNKYKYIDCYNSNNLMILAQKQKIMIELLNEPKKENNGGGNGGSKGKGLPPGAIAGIVIGVIVAIAIVVVVVILVIRKKKNNYSENSIKEDDEQKQDEV